MYIDLNLIYVILAILGCVALIYLILTLMNLSKLIKNANELITVNKNNISKSLSDLPQVVSNFNEFSGNIKDITEVATDVTADFIVTKENMKSNLEVLTEILSIVKSTYSK